jgi:hypothetical protein
MSRGRHIQSKPPTVQEHAIWMEEWRKLISKYGIDRVCNADETGMCMWYIRRYVLECEKSVFWYAGFSKVEGGRWVVCPRGCGPPRIAIDDNRAHITVLACVTMTGATLEPMFIVKGKSERVYPDIISKLTKQHVIATGHIPYSLIHYPVCFNVDACCVNR